MYRNFYIPLDAKEKRKLLGAFAIASLLLLGIGATLYFKYLELNRSREWVRHSYAVLLEMQETYAILQEMETGQRGYLLTGEKDFLKPYELASQRIDKQLSELAARVVDNPDRVRQLDELREVVASQRQLLQKQIHSHTLNPANRVLTIKEAETSKAVMDHLRSLTRRMVMDEQKLLDGRFDRERIQREAFTRILLLCVLLALLALIVTNGLIVQTTIRRRHIELALRSTQEFSSTLLDHSPDCIKLLDLNGNLLSINAGGCRQMEIDDTNACLHKPWVDFWEGDNRILAKNALKNAMRGEISRFEGECKTAKGTPRWWEVMVIPVRNTEGTITQLLSISRDMTDRHLIQQKLREDEAHFRQLADTLPQMVWVTDPNGLTEYFNKRWYDFTGVSRDETLGTQWASVFHPEDQARAWECWNRSVQTGEDYEIEYRLRRADGVYCWTLGRGLPVRDQKGNITKWYGTCTVIEDQKRVEAQLREARDIAEAANKAKSEFLANMSHEIRTPMNAVVGLANLLQNSNLTNEKRNEFVKTIQLSAQQLMELINDLLDATKLDSGNVELEQIPFNLAELLEEIISVMGVKAREKNIELIVKYTPELNGNFIGDPLRLRQVLMNLVSNAIKFTEKGMVSLEADHCKDEKTGQWNICFDVIDNGIGIPPSKIDTIFSKFSQADTTITRKYGGTGLGLSICKTLVALMNGTIKVVSTEGLGSKFTVNIPLSAAEGKAVPIKNRKVKSGVSKISKALPAEQQPLVLLVEDYRANILVATQTIEDCGYRWELAENGLEAIEKVQNGKYSAILMDVQMPMMDGITATTRIREWEKATSASRTPILGITAFSMEGDRDKCIRAGMDDYLSKPFNPEELKERIRNLTKGKN